MRNRRRGLRLQPQIDLLDDRCLLSGLTPAQVTAAYGLNAITFTSSGKTVSGNGSGETIALIEAYNDPTIASDLQTFDQRLQSAYPEADGGKPVGNRGQCHRGDE